MCRHNVASVGVCCAEVLYGDLRPGLLVRPAEVQRLGVGREPSLYLGPIHQCEGPFPPDGVIDDAVVDEVNLAIDIAQAKAGEIADLGDRHPIGDHPKHLAVRATAVLLANARTHGECPQADLAFVAMRARRGATRLPIRAGVLCNPLLVIFAGLV